MKRQKTICGVSAMTNRLAICTVIVAMAVLTGAPSRSNANGASGTEVATWNSELEGENWRIFLGAANRSALGAFIDPKSTSLGAGRDSFQKCGINLAKLVRRKFTSPVTHSTLYVRTEQSRTLVPDIDVLMKASKTQVEYAKITLSNASWIRFEPSKTTSVIYASPIWSNPTLRAQLLKCIGDMSASPVLDSILVADIRVEFFDNTKHVVDMDKIIAQLPAGENLLAGASISKTHNYVALGVNVARRISVSVNTALLFRNAKGSLGAESCAE